jgi:hypothetical protein
MSWIIEILLSCSAEIVHAILWAFGFDDLESGDGRWMRGWRLLFSVVFCVTIALLVFAGLAWLAIVVLP